jgi:hypothetical protein
MAEVLLFHHGHGQTPGVLAFAEELRRAPSYDADAASLLRKRVLDFLESR